MRLIIECKAFTDVSIIIQYNTINVALLVESRVESRLNFINICKNGLFAASIHHGSNNPSNNDEMKVKSVINPDGTFS